MHAHAILRDMLSNPLDIGATHLLQYGGVRPSQSKSFNGQAKGHGTVKDPVKDGPGGGGKPRPFLCESGLQGKIQWSRQG